MASSTKALRAWKTDYRARRETMSVQEALYRQHAERTSFDGHRIVLLRSRHGLEVRALDEVPGAVRIENACGLELHVEDVDGIPALLRTVEDLLGRTYAKQRYT